VFPGGLATPEGLRAQVHPFFIFENEAQIIHLQDSFTRELPDEERSFRRPGMPTKNTFKPDAAVEVLEIPPALAAWSLSFYLR
jgi:hypothetical protein